MRSRCAVFFVLVLLILGLLEVFVRANGEYFAALSDRLLLRIQIFERSPSNTRVLLIGTSRMLDAVNQGQLTDQMSSAVSESIRTVNGATAGIDVDGVAQFAEVAADRDGLTHIVVEASGPSLTKRIQVLATGEEEKEEDVGERESLFAHRFESQLQDMAGERIAMVQYRKAMRPKSLLKLLVLYSSNLIDPAVWSRKGLARELFASSANSVSEEQVSHFRPQIIRKADGESENVPDSEEFENLVRISEILSRSKAKVIWVMPPVTEGVVPSENQPARLLALQEIANRFGSEVWNYSDLKLDPTQYRDPSHLNRHGRATFTRILSRDLGADFKSEQGKGENR